MRQLEILDVKVIDALPEYLGLVIGFNSKTQLCMQRSQAFLQGLRTSSLTGGALPLLKVDIAQLPAGWMRSRWKGRRDSA